MVHMYGWTLNLLPDQVRRQLHMVFNGVLISGVVEVGGLAKRTDVRGAETRLLSVRIGLA